MSIHSDSVRDYWISVLTRIATPVLAHLSARKLKECMPVEQQSGAGRETCTHLEAFGRLMAGISPWLELSEAASRPFAQQAREALDAITDPASPDFANFTEGGQPLVDTAFLAQGILRAPKAFWEPLEERVKKNVIQALKATRTIKPPPCNWLLFSATVEAALFAVGEKDWDKMRIDYALSQHAQWYKGDGIYGDGQQYHADYYNSFVIQPMMIDIGRYLESTKLWDHLFPHIRGHATRYAAQLERLISPEGTFPPLGRSLVYRFGALQSLGQMALLEHLPEGIGAAQVRCAMTAVIRRMIEAPGTFDDKGWLRLGFCGAQPGVGESYISTGSLYLCSVGLLPLGLPASHGFWSDPDQPWTAVKAWSGQPFPIDHAYHG